MSLAYSERAEEALRSRQEIVDELRDRAQHDDDFDPLPAEIAHWHSQMLKAERRMRLLIAYSREARWPKASACLSSLEHLGRTSTYPT